MTNEHRTIIELSDAEQDLVAGGCSCEAVPVLQTGNDKLNLHANSPNTPANGNGFQGNGAGIAYVCPL